MTKITRKDLYTKIWEKSMVKVANELGISDRGLAKICKKHNIPTPYVGYWAKLENGYKVTKPTLQGNLNEMIDFIGQPKNDKLCIVSKKKQREINSIKQTIDELKFQSDNFNDTIAISKYLHTFKKSKEFDAKFLINSYHQKLSIKNINKAKNILVNIQSMTKELKGKFYYNDNHIVIELWGNEFHISLSEDSKRILLRKDIEKGWGVYVREIPIYTYEETNIFTITIMNCYEIKQHNFSESKNQSVEYIIKRMFKTLYGYKDDKKKAEIQELRANSKNRKKEKEAKEQYQKLEARKEQLDNLSEQLKKWQQAELIRKYIKAFAQNAIKHKDKINSAKQIREYITFVKNYADEIDPLSDYLKK